MKESSLDINWNIIGIKNLKKGMFSFILISFCSLLVIFIYNHSENSFQIIKEIKPLFFILALVATFFDMLVGGWRNHFLLRYFCMNISPWVCFKANLANVFMSAVTPSQSGGGPALFYFLYRNGVKLADAVVVSFINWISTILFFLASAAISLYVLNDEVSDGFLNVMLHYSFMTFGMISIAIVILIINPKAIEYGLSSVFRILTMVFHRKTQQIKLLHFKTIKNIRVYREGLIRTFTKSPGLFIYSISLTILLYGIKYILAYFLLLGIGEFLPFWLFMCIQATIQFVLYFAPSQGGSGIAELSIAGLLSQYLGNDALPIFTLAHRTFLLFLPALVGAVFTIRQLRKDAVS